MFWTPPVFPLRVRRMLVPLLSFLAATAWAKPAGLYQHEPAVLGITSVNFPRLVEGSNKPVLVEFYSPGCPHCVRLVDKWSAVAKSLQGHVPVGAVNCAEDALCTRYGIKGVPAIKLFRRDAKGKTYPIDYEQDRTVDQIVAFAERHADSFVVKVGTPKSGVIPLAAFVAQEAHLPHVLLFKVGRLAPALSYKTLSVDFKGKLVLGIVNSSIDGRLAEELQVALPEGRDAVAIIMPGAKRAVLYDGAMAFTPLRTRLAQLVTEQRTEL